MAYQIYDIIFKDGRPLPGRLTYYIEMNHAYDEILYDDNITYDLLFSDIEMKELIKIFSSINFKGWGIYSCSVKT